MQRVERTRENTRVISTGYDDTKFGHQSTLNDIPWIPKPRRETDVIAERIFEPG
jgi:hypothetical protein